MSVTVTGDGPSIALTGTGSAITITVTTGSSSGGGVTDHGLLTGLADDDHTQYAKKASNLSDLADAATARTNLGLGSAAEAALLDEDDMASNDATAVPSQQSVKAYVDANAGGSVATDSLWDAAGDLAVGTGADTAAKLAKGTRGQSLTVGASTLGWASNTPAADNPVASGDWFYIAGRWGSGVGTNTNGGTALSANGNCRFFPYFFGRPVGITGIGIECTTGNAGASAVLRVGLYNNSAGRPGTVAAAGATTSLNTTGAKEITFTQVDIEAGWYWIAFSTQDLDTAGTNPAFRAVNLVAGSAATRTALVTGVGQQGFFYSSGVTGAFADNPTITGIASGAPFCLWLQVVEL